jgi:tRNA A37 threonylcarbamoyladenosine dehydratase
MVESAIASNDRFGGIARLFGSDGLARLERARVLVIGVGGVGTWSAEALARSAVGTIGLVDLDDVCVTNTNRQLHALDGNFGRPKVDAMADRIRAIAPDCRVETIADFFTPATAAAILNPGWNVVIDAIDHVGNKRALIEACLDRGIPVLVSGGAGGRRDPTRVMIDDLSRSGHDGLLRELRRQLRQSRPMPAGDWGIRCVFSTEKPVFPGADGTVCEAPTDGTRLRLDCSSGFGTASFVTGVFGLALAGEAVRLVATGS